MEDQKPWKGCPCCGYLTVRRQYDVCYICKWTYDPVQEKDPEDDGGPNYVSLREAQRNYRLQDVSNPKYHYLAKKPDPDEKRDPDWKPLE